MFALQDDVIQHVKKIQLKTVKISVCLCVVGVSAASWEV